MNDNEGESTNRKMKIVIGYDGSEYADAALDDLLRAGLPRDAEALIISVAEGVMQPLSVSEIAENALVSPRVASAVAQASNALASGNRNRNRKHAPRAERWKKEACTHERLCDEH
jgi:hypothetical protein